MFCRSLFVMLSPLYRPLHCRLFFDWRLLITSLWYLNNSLSIRALRGIDTLKFTSLSNHKPGILNNYIIIFIIVLSKLSVSMMSRKVWRYQREVIRSRQSKNNRQCNELLDYLTTHTSLSPIRCGFAPDFVNYKKGCTRLAAASDKAYQLLAHGRWFSPGTLASNW
jgi:hypothetical protein